MDQELRYQILRALVRDRAFLKASARDVDPDTFPSQEESVIAKTAIDFYKEHEEPIGGLLRSEADDAGKQARLGIEGRKRLKKLIDTVQGTELDLVPVKALQNRVKRLKKSNFYTSAVDEIITAYEKNKLDATLLEDLVEKANKQLGDQDYQIRSYTKYLEKRIRRREREHENHYPVLGIEPIDWKIKAVPVGSLAMFIASYSSGKGLALLHLAVSYATQGYNVLHISLEDPKDEVEDRLDAAIAGLPKNKLWMLPNKLRNKFRTAKKTIGKRIRLIDATEDEWTVSRIERVWEKEKLKGFEADVIIVDYDDEIKAEITVKGESGRRFEFADIYRRLRRLAAKLDVIVWTASQGNKESEKESVITGRHAAEDISKVRKCFLAIGIGQSKKGENFKHLFIIRHKMDRSRFGVDIISNFRKAVFYDRRKTLRWMAKKKNGTN